MTMAWFALGNDAAVEDIEGRKERGGAVAEVVVSDPFDVTQTQGQDGLCAGAPGFGFFHPHTGPGRGRED